VILITEPSYIKVSAYVVLIDRVFIATGLNCENVRHQIGQEHNL